MAEKSNDESREGPAPIPSPPLSVEELRAAIRFGEQLALLEAKWKLREKTRQAFLNSAQQAQTRQPNGEQQALPPDTGEEPAPSSTRLEHEETWERAFERIWENLQREDHQQRTESSTSGPSTVTRNLRLPRLAESKLPWVSAVSLLYPAGATIYAKNLGAPVNIVVGYGIANLGYLLFVAGISLGTFNIFHLTKRWQVLAAGIAAFCVGTLLGNGR
jgi:hypothetical protein